jgi:hypothetical protein
MLNKNSREMNTKMDYGGKWPFSYLLFRCKYIEDYALFRSTIANAVS